MFSELECGICYRAYNAGRRCPRELRCKHSFCESCLLTLSRPRGPGDSGLGVDGAIVCPLCRHATAIPGEGGVRAELPVDESVLERLLLDGPPDEEEEGGEGGLDEDEAPLPGSPGEEEESLAGSGGRRLRRTGRKVWKMISGRSPGQRGGENGITGADVRNLAMMSCYMI
ncbi:E3 ubiquitin-protein ligase-like [Brachionichthys hirsutus]|uniref:E3 ubiquitin-protein ligase-like n=1 Tax=Brachionichthys hirsutus TaxID=412623 RepID=UPI003604BA34